MTYWGHPDLELGVGGGGVLLALPAFNPSGGGGEGGCRPQASPLDLPLILFPQFIIFLNLHLIMATG